MKKIFQSVFFLMISGLISLDAQVRIGGVGTDNSPHVGSILDLTNSNSRGLKLPLVGLVNAEILQVGGLNDDDNPSAAGMVVYNTNANTLDGTGIYYWDGHVWKGVYTAGIATCSPAYYTANTTNKVSITVKNTAHTGDTTLIFLRYNLGANPNLTPKKQMAYRSPLAGETRTDITVYGGLYQWGRKDVAHSFRCDYTALDSITNPYPDRFTIYPYTAATLASADKFVWGNRVVNVNMGDWYSPHTDTFWGNGQGLANQTPSAGANNPCPSGFRVPTQHEWALLGNEGGSSASDDNDDFGTHQNAGAGTIPNSGIVWVPVKNGAPSNDWNTSNFEDGNSLANNTGYALYTYSAWTNGFTGSGKSSLIDGDDPEPLMFLPTAGKRYSVDGRVCDAGNSGFYWSSTVALHGIYSGDKNVFYMYLNEGSVLAGDGVLSRAEGFSVRCISEF